MMTSLSHLCLSFSSSTAIFTGDGEGSTGFAAAAAALTAGGVTGFDFGINPNLDPDLALALRLSMEEERDRQEAAAEKAAEEAAEKVKVGGQATDGATSEAVVSRSLMGQLAMTTSLVGTESKSLHAVVVVDRVNRKEPMGST